MARWPGKMFHICLRLKTYHPPLGDSSHTIQLSDFFADGLRPTRMVHPNTLRRRKPVRSRVKPTIKRGVGDSELLEHAVNGILFVFDAVSLEVLQHGTKQFADSSRVSARVEAAVGFCITFPKAFALEREVTSQ